MDVERFLEAMSRLAGTIHLVATIEDGIPIGIIATSVCSLSADSPALVVCLNKATSAHDPILRQKFFTVQALSADQTDVARKFMTEKGVARFAHKSWRREPGRVPILESCLASFECELVRNYDGVSHSILIGKIVNLSQALSPTDRDCLIWHSRKFARPSAMS